MQVYQGIQGAFIAIPELFHNIEILKFCDLARKIIQYLGNAFDFKLVDVYFFLLYNFHEK